jgi:hypothetical protein
MRKFTLSFTVGAALTDSNIEAMERNADFRGGKPYLVVVDMPNWTNAVTGVLSVFNAEGTEIYASAALARNTVHQITDAVIPFSENLTAQLVLSGAPGGAGGTCPVYIYFENA